MKLVNRNDIELVDDELECEQLNACYFEIDGATVRCYLNHETYTAYIESDNKQASVKAGHFLIDLGYEAKLRG